MLSLDLDFFFIYVVPCVLSTKFYNHLTEKERVGCFTLKCLLFLLYVCCFCLAF